VCLCVCAFWPYFMHAKDIAQRSHLSLEEGAFSPAMKHGCPCITPAMASLLLN